MAKGPEEGEPTKKTLPDAERRFFEAVKENKVQELKTLLRDVDVNTQEEDGMTALMHAAYKGHTEIVQCLLSNGASQQVNCTQKDDYTALMFGTLSGSTDVVQLLLDAGARPDIVNKVNRTAAQLGAFVGRHNCVSLINNYVEGDKVKYYTQKHGLQEEAKLKEHVAVAVHKYMLIPCMNPVKMVFFIQENKDLLENYKSVYDVISTEVEKNYKNVNEIVALKLHFLGSVLKKASSWETGAEGKGGLDGLLKFMLKGRPEDGFLVNIENILRDSIKSFPYARSNLFQQLVRVLSKTKIGDDPSALSAITQTLNGIQSADFSECCVTCGEGNVTNKCSVCKMVRYCGARCQKLHWPTHKKVCPKLKKLYEKQQAEEEGAREAQASEDALAQLSELAVSEENSLETEGTAEEGCRVEEIKED